MRINNHKKTIILALIGLVLTSAFFIPASFCDAYFDACHSIRFLVQFDKLYHFLFFAGFALFVPMPRPILGKIAIGFLVLVFGIGIEFTQYYIPGRGASLHDVLANSGGVLFGLALRLIWRCWYLPMKQERDRQWAALMH